MALSAVTRQPFERRSSEMRAWSRILSVFFSMRWVSRLFRWRALSLIGLGRGAVKCQDSTIHIQVLISHPLLAPAVMGVPIFLPLTTLSPASYSHRTATPQRPFISLNSTCTPSKPVMHIIHNSDQFRRHPKAHAVSVRVSRTLRLRVGKAIWFARCFWIVGFWSRRMYHCISSFLVTLSLEYSFHVVKILTINPSKITCNRCFWASCPWYQNTIFLSTDQQCYPCQ